MPARLAAAIVSTPVHQSASGAGNSFGPVFSADGRHLVFVSHANNLVTNDDLNPFMDVFRTTIHFPNTIGYPPIGPTNLLLVSASTNGTSGANADASHPSISSNGQFVAFASRASNLVAGDNNAAVDIFLRDVTNGTTRLVSIDVSGNNLVDPAPSLNIPLSGFPLISGDGRWVFFESRATNLRATPAPLGSVNIYARDTWSNVTVLVTAATNGQPITGSARMAGLTSDGTLVAFTTTNRSLVPGVTNAGPEVYLRDLAARATYWASSNAAAQLGGAYECTDAQLARDARVIVFNATAADGTIAPLIFNLNTIGTTRVVQEGYPSFTIANSPPVISANGLVVGFQASDNCCVSQIQLWNRSNNTSVVIRESAYWQPMQSLRLAAISPDGEYICFSENVVSNSTLLGYQLLMKEMSSGTLHLLTRMSNGVSSVTTHEFSTVVIERSFIPDSSAYSLLVAFDSTASDLVAGDWNGSSDVFFRAPLWDDTFYEKNYLVSAAHEQLPATSSPAHSFVTPGSISADGKIVASLRYDDGSANRDTNHWRDVFVSNVSNGMSYAISAGVPGYYTNETGQVTYVDTTTNLHRAPVVSADGTTIAAVLSGGLQAGAIMSPGIELTRDTNRIFSDSRLVRLVSGDSPSLTSDGLMMIFRTDKEQFDSGVPDNNGVSDVWLTYFFPRSNNWYWYSPSRKIPISWNGGTTGNDASIAPRLSPDNSRVAYASRATDLAPHLSSAPYVYQLMINTLGTDRALTNYLVDTWASNRLGSYSAIATETFVWIDAYETNSYRTNVNFQFQPIASDTANFVFSGDSHYVFYGLNDGSAIYRHDLLNLHMNIVFVRYEPSAPYAVVRTNMVPGGTNLLVCTNCRNASVSGDGNVVAYERVRPGSILVDLFAKDLVSGGETLVSGNVSGAPANGTSTSPLVSGDARYVVFQSRASDLITNDTNRASDVFVRDRLLGVTMLVSANQQGLPGNGSSSRPVMAADGRTVVFQSFATDFASGDYNEKRDIFTLRLGGADSDGDGLDDTWEAAYFGNLLHDGSEDSDSDGVTDAAEFVAGTDPTDAGSVFRVLTVAPAGGGSIQLIWSGNPARQYRAEYKDDLNAANWTAVNGTIAWNGSTASIVDASATNSIHRYYRAVRLP
jgi:hypothetical protein